MAVTVPSYISSSPVVLTIFKTALGWWGLGLRSGKVSRLFIGHTSPNDVRSQLLQSLEAEGITDDYEESDRDSESGPVIELLKSYAAGTKLDLSSVPLEYPSLTPFQKQVYEAARNIPYGETRTYAQLAAEVGKPRAARAVGNTMARNRIPVLVPCHRVIGSDGRLRGFSAPQGLDLKQRMLTMEATRR